MEQTFTPNDLLRYLYGEVDPHEKNAIREALERDWLLKEKFDQLAQTKDFLSIDLIEPSATSVEIILEYNRKSDSIPA